MKLKFVERLNIRLFYWGTSCSLITLYIPIFQALNFTRASADDYCFTSSINRNGFIGFIKLLLNESSPNFIQYFILGIREIFKITPGQFSIGLFIFAILFISYFLKISMLTISQTKFRNLDYLILVSVAELMILLALTTNPVSRGSILISNFAWVAGSARVFATCLLLVGLVSLSTEKSSGKFILLLIGLGLAGLGDSELATFVCILMIKIAYEFRLHRKISKADLSIVFFLLLALFLRTQTSGSKNRLKILDQSMRNGNPVGFNIDTWNVFKWNLHRIFTEVVSLQMIISIICIGFLLGHYFFRDSIETLKQKKSTQKFGSRILLICFLTAFFEVFFTCIGSTIAYLQTWHYFGIFLFAGLVCLFLGVYFYRLAVHRRTLILLASLLVLIYSFIGIQNNLDSFKSIQSERAYLYDERVKQFNHLNLPILNLQGNAITEDIDSNWVLNCYKNANNLI